MSELAPGTEASKTLSFLRAVILSGERWTDACEKAYAAAQKELEGLSKINVREELTPLDAPIHGSRYREVEATQREDDDSLTVVIRSVN